jgi:hypothetical protein
MFASAGARDAALAAEGRDIIISASASRISRTPITSSKRR